MKIFTIPLLLLMGCKELSSAVATQVSCDAGEECSFDFDVSDKEKAAISARFFNESGELECVDIQNGEFSWNLEDDVLYVEVTNNSSNDYKLVITWRYEEIGECDVEISSNLQEE